MVDNPKVLKDVTD